MSGSRCGGCAIRATSGSGCSAPASDRACRISRPRHEPLVRAQALNHVSPYFGDVVWRGLSTEHVREGLEGHVDVDQLRELWRPISPWSFVDRLHDKNTLMVYAKYDLTFPVDLSLQLIERNQPPRLFARRADVAVRPLLDRRPRRSSISTRWYLGKFLATKL